MKMGNLEEIKKRSEAMDMIMDLLAETGDERMIFVSKANKLSNKIRDLSINYNVSKEKFKELTNIVEQFNKAIDETLKEEV